MKIAVDAMGGDHAPEHPVAGAILAADALGAEVVLVGQENRIQEALKRHSSAPEVSIVHADEVIEMDETPVWGTKPVIKYGITGVVECK